MGVFQKRNGDRNDAVSCDRTLSELIAGETITHSLKPVLFPKSPPCAIDVINASSIANKINVFDMIMKGARIRFINKCHVLDSNFLVAFVRSSKAEQSGNKAVSLPCTAVIGIRIGTVAEINSRNPSTSGVSDY